MEATKTRAFLKKIRDAHPTAFVYKVNDMSSAGIPDSVLIKNRKHVWVEFKELRIKSEPTVEQVEKAVTEIQRVTQRQLVFAGAVVYVLAFVPGKREPYVFLRRKHQGLAPISLPFSSMLELEWNS